MATRNDQPANFNEVPRALQCLRQIIELTKKEKITIEQILQDTVQIIPSGWQHPEITVSCITYENKKYKSENLKRTKWRLKSDIMVNKKRIGLIEIFYLQKKQEISGSPFLPKEMSLISAVAEFLGGVIEYHLIKKELIDSQEFSLSLLNNSPNPIDVINPDTSIEFINPALEELTGYCAEEAIGIKAPYPWWPEGEIEKSTMVLKEAMRSGATRLEELCQKKTGELFWVETTSKPICEKNKLKYLVANWVDITKRKKAEDSLKESKTKLEEQKKALEQKNIALGEIIGQIEREKTKLKDNITINVNELLFPILEKLKLNQSSRKYAQLLEQHLKGIFSDYGLKITGRTIKLTPRELEICNMIKGGLVSKEISELLNISPFTVETHRQNIRHKLGIAKKNINLTMFLNKLDS